jgi:hypothetical protein
VVVVLRAGNFGLAFALLGLLRLPLSSPKFLHREAAGEKRHCGWKERNSKIVHSASQHCTFDGRSLAFTNRVVLNSDL